MVGRDRRLFGEELLLSSSRSSQENVTGRAVARDSSPSPLQALERALVLILFHPEALESLAFGPRLEIGLLL